MIEKELLQDISREFKIDFFTVFREYMQLLFLKYFYGQKGSEKVFFKGGTALRFLYGSFRFSEDPDFSSLLSEDELRKLINKTIKKLSKETGEIRFKEEKTLADSFTGKVFYELSDFKFPLTIRLDFSLREKPVLIDTSYIETIFPIGPFPQVSHLKIEELLAEKIRAILTRERGRDIFDLYFLLAKKVKINWKLVNKKMSYYHKKVAPEDLIKRIQKFSEKEIKNDLRRFLPLTHRNMVENLKDMTLRVLKENI